MRIRDRGITKVRNRATAGLLCLIRSRNADASNLLAALFMRQVQYDTVEEALVHGKAIASSALSV